MAMNEMDTTRRYTKYKRHVNDSTERIDAQDVNQIQENINEHQEDTNIIKDTAFQERVYTIFENNLYTNAMFVDYYKTGEYLNLNESLAVQLDYNKSQLSLKPDKMFGTAISTTKWFLFSNKPICANRCKY